MSRTDTRQLLLDSMKELLNTVSFDRLRVQQICENAGTSRSVFYKYFTDKFDLAYYEYEKYEEKLRQRLLDDEIHSIEEATLYRLLYIYDRRDYYRRLIPYSGQNSFHESTTVIFVRESVMFARQVTGKEELSTEVLFSITYHAAKPRSPGSTDSSCGS